VKHTHQAGVLGLILVSAGLLLSDIVGPWVSFALQWIAPIPLPVVVYNRAYEGAAMHDGLTIGIPVLVILFGILFNQRGLDKLEARLDGRMNGLDGRMDRMQSDLVGRIDRVHSDLGVRIENVQSSLNGRMDRMQSDINSRLDRMQSDLGGRLDRM